MITDAVINDAHSKEDAGRLLYNYIFTSHFICKSLKGLFKGLHVRGCWRPNINFIFWPPLLMTVMLCLSCSLRCSTRGLGVHCWMVAFFMASYQHLLWTPNSIGGFRGPLGRVWPSLPHLVSNSLEVCWQLLWHPIQLNYIIIQRPQTIAHWIFEIECFNRHQAEITVMQFRGYSLPVHHCSGTMVPSPCPIS